MDKCFHDDQRPAFASDTLHRLLVEASRYWVIESVLRSGDLPKDETRFAYANGPHGFGWGNAPGDESDGIKRPLRGKRVRITLEIEDH